MVPRKSACGAGDMYDPVHRLVCTLCRSAHAKERFSLHKAKAPVNAEDVFEEVQDPDEDVPPEEGVSDADFERYRKKLLPKEKKSWVNRFFS